MTIANEIVSIISKVSPGLGAMLGGPAGAVVGTLMSNALGVDMTKADEIVEKIKDPDFESKLRLFESQINDLQDARQKASEEAGFMRFVRPGLAVLAFIALFVDILLIAYLENEMVKQILLAFTGMLVFDIKQIYKFYFGSSDDSSAVLPSIFKKSKSK